MSQWRGTASMEWCLARMGIYLTVVTSLLLSFVTECQSWPEGTYGLPMSKAGCPISKGFEWLTGSRVQHTEPQSHASTPINLAGIEPQHSDHLVQNFCMKTSYPQYGKYFWGRGSYCIYKKGSCPQSFKSGWIYWDDAAPFFGSTIQNYSGTVPDGEYDRNTRIEFCCRRDGSITNPITLPADSAFYLFKMAEGCQKVKNMAVTEEWVYWADEDFVNFSGVGGLYPKVHRSKDPIKFTKLYYCYYVPNPTAAKNYRVTMTVIYCISGVVALFLLVFVIALLVQKCCTRKQTPPFIIEPTENAANEAMIARPTPPVAPPPATTSIAGTSSALNILRRNGAANRDNELEYYTEPDTASADPPRYSQLKKTSPRVPEEALPMVPLASTSTLGEDSRMAMPPSYDEVIRQKESGGEGV